RSNGQPSVRAGSQPQANPSSVPKRKSPPEENSGETQTPEKRVATDSPQSVSSMVIPPPVSSTTTSMKATTNKALSASDKIKLQNVARGTTEDDIFKLGKQISDGIK